YSQVELRVAAFLSRSQPMIEAFQRGDDLHKLLARQIVQKRQDSAERRARELGKPITPKIITLDDITPEERQAGKSANFGLLYMMGPNGFREYAEDVYDVVLTDEEALSIHQA